MRFPTATLEGHIANLTAACLDKQLERGPHHLLSCLQEDGVAQIMSFVPSNQAFSTLSAVSPQTRVDAEMLVKECDIFRQWGRAACSKDIGVCYSFSSILMTDAKAKKFQIWWAERCDVPIKWCSDISQIEQAKLLRGDVLHRVRFLKLHIGRRDPGCYRATCVPARKSKRPKTEHATTAVRNTTADDKTQHSCDGGCGNLLCMLPRFTNVRSLTIALAKSFNTVSASNPHVQRALRQALRAAASLPVEEVILEGAAPLECLTELETAHGVRCLHLLDCALRSLTPLLKLTWLTEVDVSRTYYLSSLDGVAALHNLRTLRASMCQLVDISAVRECPRLVELDVSNNRNLKNLSVLSGHPSLVTLYAHGCFVSNVDGLHRCTSLSVVTITCSSTLQTLDSLVAAPSLSHIYVDGFQGGSLCPPARFSQLMSVVLRECQGLETLAGLAGLPQLTTIDVATCTLTELGPLRQCPQLLYVILDDCLELHTLDGIVGSPSLEVLTVGMCGIRNVDGIGTCPNLREVDLRLNWALDSLSGLEQAPNLTTISACSCYVQEIGQLCSCPNLQNVDLSHNSNLTDVGGLGGAPRLRHFKATGCDLESLRGLNHCPLLQVVDVSSNQSLTDLGELAGAPRLHSLTAAFAGVRNVEGLGKCPELRTLCLSGNKDLERRHREYESYYAVEYASDSYFDSDTSPSPHVLELPPSDPCSLERLADLENAPLLEELEVDNCDLIDVSALVRFPVLRTVNLLNNCLLKDASPAAQIAELRSFSFDLESFKDLSVLCSCSKLAYLKVGVRSEESTRLLQFAADNKFKMLKTTYSGQTDIFSFAKDVIP